MHREPDMGFDPGSPGSRPGPKAGAKPLHHPGIQEDYLIKTNYMGSLGGASVWRLPLAQGANLETWDRIPCRAPGAWSLLLPLPMSLPCLLYTSDAADD